MTLKRGRKGSKADLNVSEVLCTLEIVREDGQLVIRLVEESAVNMLKELVPRYEALEKKYLALKAEKDNDE